MPDNQDGDMTTAWSNLASKHREIIDDVCLAFEKDWNSGNRRAIEDCLAAVDDALQPDLVAELVGIEVELRVRDGETPQLNEYASRFPNHEPTVVTAFQSSMAESSNDQSVQQESSVQLPDRFGEFRVLREIGRGGMGVVYEAIQESLRRPVALKTLLHRFESNAQGRLRFDREARAIARLHHTNIVDVFGNGEQDGVPFFAMRFINGAGLDEVLRKLRGKASAGTPHGNEVLSDDVADRSRVVARIGRETAEALNYAHANGVIHRDVKPSNILIDETGTPWLTDFGLARLTESQTEAGLTGDGKLLGTLRYLPPEALDGTADALGDQYSLGLTLYECIALRPAFERTDAAGLIDDLKSQLPPRLESLQPATPRDLATIIHKAIDREPRARYSSAGELAADLQRFLNDEPIQARRVSWQERMLRWSRRNKRLAASLSVVALLLLVALVASVIVAGHLGGLNEQLNSNLSKLTLRTGELTDKTKSLAEARDTAVQTAEENRRLATDADVARDKAEDTVYFSRIAQTDLAWQTNDVRAAVELLRKCEPGPDGVDRRGWESRYLNRLCHSECVHIEFTGQYRYDFVSSSAFSPDGRWLVTGSSEPWTKSSVSDATVWDTRDYSMVATAPMALAAPGNLRFCSDSQRFAVFDKDGVMAFARHHDPHDNSCPAVSLDQISVEDFVVRTPIVAEFDRQAVGTTPVILRERVSGKRLRELIHPGGIFGATVSTDGRMVATAGFDTTVRVWNSDTGEVTHILRGHTDSVLSVAFHPVTALLASTARDGIRIWDLTQQQSQLTLRVPPTIQGGGQLMHFAFSEDSKDLIAVTDSDGDVVIGRARVATGELLELRRLNHLLFAEGFDRYLISIDPAGRRLTARLRDRGGSVTVCNFAGRVIHELRPESGRIRQAAMSGDGRLIATSSLYRSSASLWSAGTGRLLHEFPTPSDAISEEPPGRSLVLAFSASGDQLACKFGKQAGIYVWDTATGRLRCELSQPGRLRTGVFSADGQQFAVHLLGTNQIHVFDLTTGEVKYSLPAEPSDIDLEFSPTEHRLATVGRQGPVYLWDTDSGELVLRLRRSTASLGTYNYDPYVRWSPDGRRIAASNWLGDIDVWDATARDREVSDRIAIAETRSALYYIHAAITARDRAIGLSHTRKVKDLTNLSPAVQINRGLMWAHFGEWKLAAADLYPATPHPNELRIMISERIAKSTDTIRELGTLLPDVPELQVALAELAKQLGDTQTATRHREHALALYEQEFLERQDDEYIARQLADLIRGSHKQQWQPLAIASVESTGNATLTMQDDGSILASGNNTPGDVYTIRATSDIDRLAAIRLDVLADESLPQRGPGRHPSGNFQLAAIRLFDTDHKGVRTSDSFPFKDAWASFQYPAPDVNVVGAIREDDTRVWHTFGQFGQPSHAVFVLERVLTRSPDQPLIIELRHRGGDVLNIGRFRISCSTDPFVIRDLNERRFLSSVHLPGFMALAAARLSAGENEQALATLKRIPTSNHAADSAIRLLLLARVHRQLNQLGEAQETYDELIRRLDADPLPVSHEWLTSESIRSEANR